MTVQELIDELSKIEDKTLIVTTIDYDDGIPDLWEVYNIHESESFYNGLCKEGRRFETVEGKKSIVIG